MSAAAPEVAQACAAESAVAELLRVFGCPVVRWSGRSEFRSPLKQPGQELSGEEGYVLVDHEFADASKGGVGQIVVWSKEGTMTSITPPLQH
jgi:hypothetical protein